ncbi:MAG: hypothetical protein ACR2RB_16355, partial [Gammaproteobacteria bacterium]
IAHRAVPIEKVFFGIPLYAEGWQKLSGGAHRGLDEDLGFSDVQDAMRRYGATLTRSEQDGSSFIEYTDVSEDEFIVWFEDAVSVGWKLPFLDKYGIHKIAFWHLGGADPSVWRTLRNS